MGSGRRFRGSFPTHADPRLESQGYLNNSCHRIAVCSLAMNTKKFIVSLMGSIAILSLLFSEEDEDASENKSGLRDGERQVGQSPLRRLSFDQGFTQIRLDRKNWEKIIRLMQEKNGLWPLGTMESKILDYLEKNYTTDEHHNPKIRRPLLD